MKSTLLDHFRRPGLRGGIPLIVEKVSEWVWQNGLEVEGIFRVSGTHSSVLELKKTLEKGIEVEFSSSEDPYVIAGALMQWLVELEPPLLTYDLYENFLTAQRIELEEERQKRIVDDLSHLPTTHRESLGVILKLFHEIDKHNAQNKMNAASLAIIVSPSILRNKVQDLHKEAGDLKVSICLVENLILNYKVLYQKLEEKLQNPRPNFFTPRKPNSKSSSSGEKTPRLPADHPDRTITPDDVECISSLSAILSDPQASEAFMAYLREKELSDENLLFYNEIEKFRRLTNHAERFQEAKRILGTYISEEANYQVNIDSDVRRNIEDALEASSEQETEEKEEEFSKIFDESQKFVFNLIQEHSYPRFLQSPQGRGLVKTIESNRKKK